MGPDLAHADAAYDPDDPLLERTPLPAECDLPGWRDAAAHYYRAMEKVGAALMASIARSLGLDETIFDPYFRRRHLDLAADPLSAARRDRRRRSFRTRLPGRAQGREPADHRARACRFRFRDAAGAGRRGGPAGEEPCRRLDRRAAGRRHAGGQFRPIAGTLDGRRGAGDAPPRHRAEDGRASRYRSSTSRASTRASRRCRCKAAATSRRSSTATICGSRRRISSRWPASRDFASRGM